MPVMRPHNRHSAPSVGVGVGMSMRLDMGTGVRAGMEEAGSTNGGSTRMDRNGRIDA